MTSYQDIEERRIHLDAAVSRYLLERGWRLAEHNRKGQRRWRKGTRPVVHENEALVIQQAEDRRSMQETAPETKS